MGMVLNNHQLQFNHNNPWKTKFYQYLLFHAAGRSVFGCFFWIGQQWVQHFCHYWSCSSSSGGRSGSDNSDSVVQEEKRTTDLGFNRDDNYCEGTAWLFFLKRVGSVSNDIHFLLWFNLIESILTQYYNSVFASLFTLCFRLFFSAFCQKVIEKEISFNLPKSKYFFCHYFIRIFLSNEILPTLASSSLPSNARLLPDPHRPFTHSDRKQNPRIFPQKHNQWDLHFHLRPTFP